MQSNMKTDNPIAVEQFQKIQIHAIEISEEEREWNRKKNWKNSQEFFKINNRSTDPGSTPRRMNTKKIYMKAYHTQIARNQMQTES